MNAFISLLDTRTPIVAIDVVRSLARVPFITHQFRWLVTKVAVTGDARLLSGYTGVKKITPLREARLADCVTAIQGLDASQLSGLPDRIMPGVDVDSVVNV